MSPSRRPKPSREEVIALEPEPPAEAEPEEASALEPEPPAEAEPEEAIALESEPPAEVEQTSPAELPIDQDEELFFSFINESLEHIETIEVNLVTLENDPDDQDAINAVFRPFHTIKGVSGFLNLGPIHRLTHNVENLLDDARSGRVRISSALVDLVLDAVDTLRKMIEEFRAGLESGGPGLGDDWGLEEFFERLESVRGIAVEAAPAASVKDLQEDACLGEILVEHGLLSAKELEELLAIQSKNRLKKLGEIVVERGVVTQEALAQALVHQVGHQDKKLGEILVETGQADTAAVFRAVEEQTALRNQKLGELLIREKQVGAREVAGALREQRRGVDGAAASRTVKVDTAKLDELVDTVGELVIAQSLVASNQTVRGLKDQKLGRDLSQLGRITSELQRTAMSPAYGADSPNVSKNDQARSGFVAEVG